MKILSLTDGLCVSQKVRNGNLETDNRRGLSYEYNYLNLLSGASRYGISQVRYGYTSDGEKLGVTDNSGRGYEYRGSFQYLREGSSLTLEGVLFGEGRILLGSNGYKVYYYLKDHLGSIRCVIDSSGNVCERNDYYPFGQEHEPPDYPQLLENRSKYNGKERQDIGDLNFLDYGARMYDSHLGRWFVADPLLEKYYGWSPYAYCTNNPLKFVDPTGMLVDDYFSTLGRYLGCDDASTDIVRVMSQDDWNKYRIKHADGTESISHQTGEKLSDVYSKAMIWGDDINLRIYNHYNPTDLPLFNSKNKETAGMSFRVQNGFMSIGVNLEKNREKSASNHINIIKNMFIHEKQHYEDYKKLGEKFFTDEMKPLRELRATHAQMEHETFQLTNSTYQESVKKYQRKFIKILPISIRQIPLSPIINPY